jgi:hypothetical protein
MLTIPKGDRQQGSSARKPAEISPNFTDADDADDLFPLLGDQKKEGRQVGGLYRACLERPEKYAKRSSASVRIISIRPKARSHQWVSHLKNADDPADDLSRDRQQQKVRQHLRSRHQPDPPATGRAKTRPGRRRRSPTPLRCNVSSSRRSVPSRRKVARVAGRLRPSRGPMEVLATGDHQASLSQAIDLHPSYPHTQRYGRHQRNSRLVLAIPQGTGRRRQRLARASTVAVRIPRLRSPSPGQRMRPMRLNLLVGRCLRNSLRLALQGPVDHSPPGQRIGSPRSIRRSPSPSDRYLSTHYQSHANRPTLPAGFTTPSHTRAAIANSATVGHQSQKDTANQRHRRPCERPPTRPPDPARIKIHIRP